MTATYSLNTLYSIFNKVAFRWMWQNKSYHLTCNIRITFITSHNLILGIAEELLAASMLFFLTVFINQKSPIFTFELPDTNASRRMQIRANVIFQRPRGLSRCSGNESHTKAPTKLSTGSFEQTKRTKSLQKGIKANISSA